MSDSTDLPWLDTSSTGYGAGDVGESERQQFVRALREAPSLLGETLKAVAVDFAADWKLEPDRREIPEKHGGGEGWTFVINHERLERWIQFRVSPDDVRGIGRRIAVRTLARWTQRDERGGPAAIWETIFEPRCFGLTTRTPADSFREVLELARRDAIAYTPGDLEPIPIGAPNRPLGLPWVWM